MKHIYEHIEGWFGFTDLYSAMVEKFNNAIFVEVGSWLGRSTTYMAVEIINRKKNIKFYSVDTWEGGELLKKNRLVTEKKLFNQFLINIESVKKQINILKMESIDASKLFEDNSVDFCFIDADHLYENVKNDIEAWYPKVKVKGVLAGHDYPNEAGVVKAVDEFVENYKLNLHFASDSTWYVSKQLK